MSNFTNPELKSFNFNSNSSFLCFDQFRLKTYDFKLMSLLDEGSENHKKVMSLVAGCIKRYHKNLYKGQKYYLEDLQIILDTYSDSAPAIIKSFNITLNKSATKVCVQCHHCANFSEVFKFCLNCEHAHYCQEVCEINNKLTHERQECRRRPFPAVYKALQVQIHVGSDLGYNVQIFFQHEVSMTLLLRGEQLLQQIIAHFKTDSEGKGVLGQFEIKNEGKMLKFQRSLTKPIITEKNSIIIQSIDQMSKFYTSSRILQTLQSFLLQKGGILWKKIRQIHDNHFRQIFVFHCP